MIRPPLSQFPVPPITPPAKSKFLSDMAPPHVEIDRTHRGTGVDVNGGPGPGILHHFAGGG